MKRLSAICALFLSWAVLAHAQANLGGLTGMSKPLPPQQLSVVPADQYLDYTHVWDFAPVGTLNGLYVQQTTAAGVTITAQSPFLALTAGTANRRVLITEGVATTGFDFTSITNIDPTGDVTIAVPIYGLDLVMASTTAWFQLAYGDTTNFIVDKIPNSGFGIIVTGSSNADTLFASANTITGYVSSGSDTSYVPLMTNSGADIIKLWIHANPSAGAVEFWIDGVKRASIASPVRANSASNVSIWENGAGSLAAIYLGPMRVQRAWP